MHRRSVADQSLIGCWSLAATLPPVRLILPTWPPSDNRQAIRGQSARDRQAGNRGAKPVLRGIPALTPRGYDVALSQRLFNFFNFFIFWCTLLVITFSVH